MMQRNHRNLARTGPGRLRGLATLCLAIVLLGGSLQGCAALSNPIANGVPVRMISPDLLGESRSGMETIPLTLLRQKPPAAYRLDRGDVLGVWIDGILGEKGATPPTRLLEGINQIPAVGVPISVRADGTISLPLIPAVNVRGMTIEEAQEAVRTSYTVKNKVLQPGQERIIVTLIRPRTYHIIVIRQDSVTPQQQTTPGVTTGVTAGAGASGFVISAGGERGRGSRRGTGFAIDLPAYENDVLNALARTGGFPGTDAVNEVVIERGSANGAPFDGMQGLPGCPPGGFQSGVPGGGQTIRIPLRVRHGELPNIRPEDIILQTGDSVFIAAREADLFYTGGLLPPGEHLLPRDTDLDVIEAITQVSGILDSGGLNPLNIQGTVFVPGIGSPSPSLLTVVRRTPNGEQVAIRVNLNEALRDPRERILVQPKDVLILQETPQEAFARYMSTNFNFSFLYTFVNNGHATAISSSRLTQPLSLNQ
jgi:protein involved in polysaccharide export with SLBB domain